jgi:hypothetical protein
VSDGKLPPPIKPRTLVRRKNSIFGYDYFTSDGRYKITPYYADNRGGGHTARIDHYQVQDTQTGKTIDVPRLDDVRLYYCTPINEMPWLVCDMDDGVMRIEPTYANAVEWRRSFDDGLFIVRADRAHLQGWDALQQPLYPYPDDPFERVDRPAPNTEETPVPDASETLRPAFGLGLPSGTLPKWYLYTGAGANAEVGNTLPDGSDVTRAATADLVVTFCTVMDSMARTNNTSGLADLGRYAGQLWSEMTGRGVEFK